MRIFIPYASEELAREYLIDAAKRTGVRIEIEYVGKPRIRNHAPGIPNVPHNEFRVRLHLIGENYRKLSVRPWDQSRIRRVNAVCWHGYKNFFVRLLNNSGRDDITIRTGQIGKIEYKGWKDFVSKFPATKFKYYDGYSACRCSGMDLAGWELASDHFPPGDFIRKTG